MTKSRECAALALVLAGCSSGSATGTGDPTSTASGDGVLAMSTDASSLGQDGGSLGNDGGSDRGDGGPCTAGASQSCTQTNGAAGVQFCDEWTQNDGYQLAAFWSSCLPPTCSGTEVACATASGAAGVAQCADGETASGCATVSRCHPGDVTKLTDEAPCNAVPCTIEDGAWVYPSCNTPLVLAFHDEPVAFTRAGGEFDLTGREASIATDWVSATTPWLALDRDGNGAIDDGRELFGSMTDLAGGVRAPNGFAALAALDADGDGEITDRDPAFARLLVWRDSNQDRRSSPNELESAASAGLVAIRLDYRMAPRCAGGDCEVERASFVYRDASGREREGAVVDVHLAEGPRSR